jgi:hypothetical protein
MGWTFWWQALLVLDLASPHVQMQASVEEPYVDQRIQLHLDIHLPFAPSGRSAALPHLQVPWLDRIPSSQQWLEKHSLVVLEGGASFRINTWPQPVVAETVRASRSDRAPRAQRYRFTWTLETNRDMAVLPPVILQLDTLRVESQPLFLLPRELPRFPAQQFEAFHQDGFHKRLVGDYQVEAAVDALEIDLNQETLLTLTLRGTGNLERLSRPPLNDMAEDLFLPTDWKQRWRVRNDSEGWNNNGTTRYFRYWIKPRLSGPQPVPRFFYTAFDPRLQIYQTKVTNRLVVQVRPPPGQPAAEPTTAASIPERLRPQPLAAELLRQERTIPSGTVLALLVLGPPLLCGWLWWRQQPGSGNRWWPRVWRRWTPAGRRAYAALRAVRDRPGPGQVEAVTHALVTYLQERYGMLQAEPTPDEVEAHLHEAGVSAAAIQSARDWFQACTAARFTPHRAFPEENLFPLACRVLQELEASA